MESKRTGKKRSGSRMGGACLIPPRVPVAALRQFTISKAPHKERRIAEYVEWQARRYKEKVTHLEMVTTETVFGRRHEVWDVHTNRRRWWVITEPTHLYSQSLFPSLDYTLSFHIGLMARVLSHEKGPNTHEEAERLAPAWRRWIEASNASERADEAEDFQAVGMRCREALVEVARSMADDKMVPEGTTPPKLGDFVGWAEIVADTVARGPSAERVRGYLKATSKAAWQLVSWLVHASGAVRFDAQLAVDATQAVLAGFGAAVARYERGGPDRCPRCHSYRLGSAQGPAGEDPTYVTLCEACGWKQGANAGEVSTVTRRGSDLALSHEPRPRAATSSHEVRDNTRK